MTSSGTAARSATWSSAVARIRSQSPISRLASGSPAYAADGVGRPARGADPAFLPYRREVQAPGPLGQGTQEERLAVTSAAGQQADPQMGVVGRQELVQGAPLAVAIQHPCGFVQHRRDPNPYRWTYTDQYR
ncbi:hypothetical protein [Streptomyces sp. SID3212]|uniref:hypothetical protein n=1 Tax=Streptomyces sp. SID3212 TaxID=2690259 RepID=UPI0031F6EAFE